MSYVLHGVIGTAQALRPCRAFVNSIVANLGEGLGLMPISDDLFDEVRQGDHVNPQFASAQWFPPGFEAVLAGWSLVDPVAYVEAEYFGGIGSQFAAVWHDAALVLGPLMLSEDEPRPAAGWSPISQALRRLGVSADGHYDEFDAINLGRHRDMDDWTAALQLP